MSREELRITARRDALAEEQVDVRGYLGALRRSLPLIVGIVVVLTGLVAGLSLALPNNYRATTKIVQESTASPLGSTDAESTKRLLATTQRLLTTPEVLAAAATQLPGESESSLEGKVTSSVDPEANIVKVVANDGSASGAAAIANAVAASFLQEHRRLQRASIARARQSLLDELNRLRGSPNADSQIAAIRSRLNDLAVSQASAGSDLQLAEKAAPPAAPSSPRPLRNGLLAFFAALFLGVLVALGRDRLVPRIGDARELGRLMDLPVLAGVPYVRRRPGRRLRTLGVVEEEAYQTLRTTLNLAMPPGEQHVLLVTSAVHGEGKTTVTAKLGRALARAGQKTLLVSGDLRWPTLHEMFDMPVAPGLAEILAAPDREKMRRMLADSIKPVVPSAYLGGDAGNVRNVNLHVLPSGSRPAEPALLLSSAAVSAVVAEIGQLDYTYVLVDSAPLIGIADGQVLAHEIRHSLMVARLDRVNLDNVADMRDLIERLETTPLGLIVIGARGELSPYYLPSRAPMAAGARGSPG